MFLCGKFATGIGKCHVGGRLVIEKCLCLKPLYRELNGLLVSFTFHIHYKGFSLSISLFTFSLISATPSLLCAAAFLSYLSVLKRFHFHIQRE
jgi:hypothetical protein